MHRAPTMRGNKMKIIKFFLIITTTILLSACSTFASSSSDRVDKPIAAMDNVELGLAYLHDGDRVRAKTKLLLAFNQAPESPVVLDAMAYFFEASEENTQAQRYYQKALWYAPHNGAVLNNYGVFLCKMGRYVQAEHYLTQAAMEHDYVHTAKAYENAGLCALMIPDQAKARYYFQKALDEDPRLSVSRQELTTLHGFTK